MTYINCVYFMMFVMLLYINSLKKNIRLLSHEKNTYMRTINELTLTEI